MGYKRIALVVALAVFASGCFPWSLTVVGPPADYSPVRHGRPVCDDSAAGRQLLDVVGLFGSGLGALVAGFITVALAGDGGEREVLAGFGALTVVGGLGTIMHGYALGAGRARLVACREAEGSWDQYVEDRRDLEPVEEDR